MANEEVVSLQALPAIKAKYFERAAWSTGVMGAAALFFFLLNLDSDDTPMSPFLLLFFLALAFNVEEYFSYIIAKKRAISAKSESEWLRRAGVDAPGATDPT
ncbi:MULTISPECIES: hypothetical protein [Brevibacterium]|uniref:hypothetical protein n=1 Tax=Brevibacterium TaxID=1696 RepID=UPI000F6544DD|nr:MULTISPECIES: hypothetical protein [Brevibacterium]AZL08024.1 hypothetical protein CXR26_01315 [Brevibacterium aurantiacum]